MTRRSFLKYGFRLSLLAVLGFGFTRRNNLVTEKYTLKFTNLPKSFDGFRIVQISDLHASFWVGKEYLDQVVERVNRLPKDLTVITGDIITGSVNDFWKRWLPTARADYIPTVIEALSMLDNGQKVAVLGNHDQWDGKETENRLVSELERIGIDVLRNRSSTISRGQEEIYIAGMDDIWFSYDIDRALKGISSERFIILLSHSPDVREDIKSSPKIELTLCGHTHGGQVAIPHVSHHFIPIKNPARYLSGLVKESIWVHIC